ncbi:MAG: mfpsA [Bryobacterales bacterium]|nr:mfpsA [Bryobacterales bacterium]
MDHGTGQTTPSPCCLNITAHMDHRFGGLTTSLPDFCEALRSTESYRSELAAFCVPGETSPGPEKPAVFPFGRARWSWDSSLRQRLRLLIGQADAVHMHGLWREHCSLGSSFAKAARKPYLISPHGMLEPWAFKNKAWKKKVYWNLFEQRNLASAQCLRALTVAEAAQLRDLGLRVPVAVIPNGVLAPPVIDPAPFFQRFPDLRDRTIILFLGRLHPKKGIHMLCNSWGKVCGEYPHAHLVMAGPDSDGQQQSLEAIVAEHGISSRVTFAGMLRGEEKWGALSAASFFTLPSYSEGFSIAVLEALAAGTPVILSKQCYFPEVGQYECGWTIDPEPAALERSLRECMELSSADRLDMGARARHLVNDRFTWPVIGAKSASVLDWLLGGGSPPACVEIAA